MKSFSEKIEDFEQAKKTEPDLAYGNTVSKASSNRRQSAQGGRTSNRENNSRNRGERDRRLSLRGKCFRCAKGDHMIPSCSYPETVKCNLCGAIGHITPACSRRQAANSTQHIPSTSSAPSPSSYSSSAHHQLAITYDGGSNFSACLLYTSPSPRDRQKSRMPSSA